MDCPQCHADFPAESNFCPYCGTQIARDPYPTSYIPGQSSLQLSTRATLQKSRQWLFWIPFLMLLVLSLLFYWAVSSSPIGWAVLVVSFSLLLLMRKRVARVGVLAGLGIWTGVAVVLFSAMLATFTPVASDGEPTGGVTYDYGFPVMAMSALSRLS